MRLFVFHALARRICWQQAPAHASFSPASRSASPPFTHAARQSRPQARMPRHDIHTPALRGEMTPRRRCQDKRLPLPHRPPLLAMMRIAI